MTDQIHLLPKHRRNLEELLRQHLPNVEVWAYGSRVNGRSHRGSDLDLVLRGPGLEEIPTALMEVFIDAVEQSDIPFLVDTRDWARLPERFQDEIERRHLVVVPTDESDIEAEKLFDSVPDGWQQTTLGTAVEQGGGQIQTGPFGSQLHASDYVPAGIPSIMPQNIGDNRINAEGIARITPRDASRLERYLVQQGDIVYSRRGDVERRALIRAREDGWLCGTGCLRVRFGEDSVDPKYASYFLGHPSVREWIVRHAHGATMRNLNTSILSSCPFVVPSKGEQRAIADILGTLDDRIELNRRTNETLEAMARALFKSWFVDFDPVRAKMAELEHGLPSDLARLFPSRLVQSELGSIPEGWGAGCLADVSWVTTRGVDPSSVSEQTPYIGLEHMPRKSIALTEWGVSSAVVSGKWVFDQGDVLFGKLRPYFHKVGIAPVDGLCSTDILVVKPQAAEWSAFVCLCFSSAEFVAYTDRTSTGTKMPRTCWKTMGRYPLCLPPKDLAQAFRQVVQPIIQQVISNVHESRSLGALRDALLPKLVSGQWRLESATASRRRVAV